MSGFFKRIASFEHHAQYNIVLGFITAFPTKKMKDDTYGTLPASIYLAFVASSAGITLVMSSLLVRWTLRGKRPSFKIFLLALVDGAVPFSEVMTFLAFLAVVGLPSIYNSGHIRKLLVYEVNVYLQLPLPQLAVSGWIEYQYDELLTQH